MNMMFSRLLPEKGAEMCLEKLIGYVGCTCLQFLKAEAAWVAVMGLGHHTETAHTTIANMAFQSNSVLDASYVLWS